MVARCGRARQRVVGTSPPDGGRRARELRQCKCTRARTKGVNCFRPLALRHVATWSLSTLADASDVVALRALAQRDPDAMTRNCAFAALAMLGDDAGRHGLVADLGHADASIRSYAAEIAGHCRELSSADRLIGLLDDPLTSMFVSAPQPALEYVTASAAARSQGRRRRNVSYNAPGLPFRQGGDYPVTRRVTTVRDGRREPVTHSVADVARRRNHVEFRMRIMGRCQSRASRLPFLLTAG